MAELLRQLILVAVDHLRNHRKLRAVILATSLVIYIPCLWIFVGVHTYPWWWNNHYHLDPNLINDPLIGLIGISSISSIVCLLSFLSKSILESSRIDTELQPIREERKEIRDRIGQESVPNIFDTIQLGLNQITEYYTINKGQARKSFTFSVFAVISGLLTLIGGIWLFYFGATPNLQLTALTGIGGLLLQFIGGASFYIYNKSLEQLNYFFDKLIRVQDTMLSIQLCNDISDPSRRDVIRERLILQILTRHSDLGESNKSSLVMEQK
jgi:hypothetical protein